MLEFVAALVGWCLLLASLPKLFSRRAFIQIVAEYGLIPKRLTTYIGTAIPYLELTTGLLILINPAWSYSLTIAAFLYGAFAGAVTVNLLRGRTHISCGCFGSNEGIGWSIVYRNVLFFLGAVIVGSSRHHTNLSAFEYLSIRLVAAGCIGCFGLIATVRRILLSLPAATTQSLGPERSRSGL
jgi:hypothetical protein